MNCFFSVLLEQIDNELGDKLNEFPYNRMPKTKQLFEEEADIYKIFNDLGMGRIVFCHNDSNQKNIIWNPQTRTLGFIDFEMTMNNYAVIEMGYLFGCYPGHFLYDFNRDFFPSHDYRRRFLRKYQEEFNKLNGINLSKDDFEKELELLSIRTDLSILLFCLRLSTIGKLFDNRPDMFKNEDLKKNRAEIPHFCSKWSLQLYEIYVDYKDEFVRQAQEYLNKKNQPKKETQV